MRALSVQISLRSLVARPLDKISKRDLSVRSLYEISVQALYKKPSWQDLCKRSHGKISATDFYAMSLYKVSRRCPGKISVNGLLARSQQISMQCLCARSLYELSRASSLEEFSWQDVCKRPLGKIPATHLYTMSLYKISIRGLLARLLKRPLYKRSEGSQVRSLFKLSIKDL